MTISTDRTTERTVDEFVIDAYTQIGTWNPSWSVSMAPYQGKIMFGRRKLQDILDSIPTDGVSVKSVYFYNQTLEADKYIYDMPAGTMRVLNDGAYIGASETDITKASAEYPVREISREDWQARSPKDTPGRPTSYFQDRSGSLIEVNLWPIPNEAGTIRFQLQRRAASVRSDGSATIEVSPAWMEYLQFRLAYVLSISEGHNADRFGPLRSEASRLKTEAQGFSHQNTPSQATLEYPARWRR
jgi:hypothetical protein